MNICRKIQFLLRLAELCDPSESDRKRMYMDCVDELMNYTPQQEIEKDEILGLFDFAAPIEMWGWKRVISLMLENPDLFYGYTTSSLGRELIDISKDNMKIKRRRTSAGVWYFLPPFKERFCK